MGLAGCGHASATRGGPATSLPQAVVSSPTPEAVITVGETLSGVGPTDTEGEDLSIPTGARSVTVQFSCGSGWYAVNLSNATLIADVTLNGACGERHDLVWPITNTTVPKLIVFVSDGVQWQATPTFSTAAFVYDAAVTSDCKAFAPVLGALMDADVGYTHYHAIDATEWTSEVTSAAQDLHTLTASSHSTVHDALVTLFGIISSPQRTVGAVLSDTTNAPIQQITQACNANQTPIVTTAKYGG
jgi:hypothetical protein